MLTVLREDGRFPPARSQRGQGCRAYIVWCDCGAEKRVRGYNLKSGNTTNCGCVPRRKAAERARVRNVEHPPNLQHSLTRHAKGSNYDRWHNMMARCYDPSRKDYKWYGGRGIKVAQRWWDVSLFITDVLRALGPCPERWTLDRIDVDGDYEPGNVQWVTRAHQSRNTRRSREKFVSGEL